MLIDCFTFYNELDMLRFRIKELKDVVEYFVLVEATQTFNFESKRLYFNENKHLFETYNIVHVIVDDMPTGDGIDVWWREKFQRNAMQRGLDILNLSKSDIVLVNDVDEIPDRETLAAIKKSGIQSIHALGQDVYYYNFNCKFNGKWYHPKIMNYGNLLDAGSAEMARFTNAPIIQKGGWHLSYFGNPEFIANKINSFSHQEYNSEEFTDTEKIQERIRGCKDLFAREGMDYQFIEINENNYLPHNYKMLL